MRNQLRLLKPNRQLMAGMSLALCIALLIWQGNRLLDPKVLGVADFVEYWSAARLNITGGNPYAPEPLLALQQKAGWDGDQPIPMWNPLWTLTLVMPFGLLSFSVARLLWLGLQLVIILSCTGWLWCAFGGPRPYRWLTWILSFSFCPTLVVLHMGQLGPLMLLGVVLFLRFVNGAGKGSGTQAARHPAFLSGLHGWLAGAALVLVSVKPHVVYLLWLAVLLWGLDRRRWSIFAGAGLGLLLATVLTLCFNPSALTQYREALSHRLATETLDFQTPTLGAFLRLVLGERLSWMQYVPSLLASIWFIGYWRKRRRAWDWREEMPLLLLVSFPTAVYGWLGDQVILLPALIQGALWVFQGHRFAAVRLVFAVYVVLDAVVLLTKIYSVPEWGLAWTGPALLIGYLVLRRWVALGSAGANLLTPTARLGVLMGKRS